MVSSQFKLPISAFVASCNEAHLLERCLNGLFFCEEIFVVDLSCKDETVAIAKKMGAHVIAHHKVDVIEEIFPSIIPYSKRPWILMTDPDELLPLALAMEIKELFETSNLTDFAAIKVPFQYYFKNTPLKGTIWGGNRHGRLLFNKGAIKLSTTVHQGIQINEDKMTYLLPKKTNDMVIQHFWVTSYRSFLAKHKRYILQEGKALFNRNIKYHFLSQMKMTIHSFKECYFMTKGYKDGLLGLFLSTYWAYYNFKSWQQLAVYEKNTFKINKVSQKD
ncbi:hypothetical protein [Pedobacter sp. ASV28]|uniref:hypothetical protein n=1 Tax=Pedobacter sp. ASV28 TaxID=2795123 RepID=UPI001E537B91|nr:hypothetical protein [Pedobacter sp. ASV28]